MSVLKFCDRCGALKEQGHRHRVKDTRPSARARGYDHRWAQTRRRYLAAFPTCQHSEGCIQPATDVHHLDGEGPKGERGHDYGNLVGYCHAHHSQLTASEQPGGWNREAKYVPPKSIPIKEQRLVILVGRSGVGKTSVRRHLADLLKARGLGPDDHPHRWDWVIRQMDKETRVVLECAQIPRAVRARLKLGDAVVELIADADTRRRRLSQQGLDVETVNQRLRQPSALGYEDPITPTLTLQTTASAQEVAQRIADRVGVNPSASI